MKKSITTLFIMCAFSLLAQPYPEVSIPDSQVRNLSSAKVSGQEYELHISLPWGYDRSSKKYPVIYLMDSQWDFPLVSAIYGEQYYDGFVPEAIIVGVTWGGENPNPDKLRARDYTPPNSAGVVGLGGADLFLDFMETELFPFIEREYKANNNRTLMGCSLGGLFTLYTLFTHTDLFTSYVAASPALGWDNHVLLNYEKAFLEKQPTNPISLYMTVGDVESNKSEFEDFATTMELRSYKNVRLHSKVLENTGHSGTKSETYSRGLQFSFERNQLKLSDAVLNKYVGTYQLGDNEVEIKNEKQQLKLYASQNSFPLLAHSESHFYATFQFFNIHFKDADNAVQGFDLITYGGSQTFNKVKK